IKSEAFACPITRAAQLFELLDDDAAVLLFPGPDVFQKLFAADIIAMLDQALLAQGFHDDRLGPNPGVVGAREPKYFFAFHPSLAGEDVLDRIIQDMAHVEHARDVRRWDDDGVSRLYGSRVRHEAPVTDPEVIPFILDGLRVVSFGNFRHKATRI